jgi:ketosteroid isomerase-like protein
VTRAGAGFLAAFGSGDRARLAEFYREDAVLWTPLTGPLRGREAIGGYFSDLHSAFPGLRVSLHDEFCSPDGGQACIRVHLDWQNTGSFRGHPPAGRSGEMAETHSFRLADGLVTEQVAGVSSFQIPRLFLADWGLGFPREAGDPAPEICSAAPGDAPAGAGGSLARRFVDAFGRRDPAALAQIYAADVVLYTPLAWPARGRDALTAFALEFHTANPGLRIALHDEFYSADGTRACWRIRLHYHNTGPFYGNPPTGETGVMTETHAVRLAGGRITEHVVGDNTFHMPHQELVTWQMPFPERTPDPAPPITSATARHHGAAVTSKEGSE